MKDPDNIRSIEALGVDMMGFIFYPPSPRNVGDEVPAYMPSCRRVGVFVNEAQESLLGKCKAFGLDTVQMHGNESPEQCAAIKSAGYRVIKALSISDATDIVKASEYEGSCDMLIFDTKCKTVGGSGTSFDWSLLSSYKGTTGFLLSGGIGPDSELGSFSHPRLLGYDLNSRFETAPGIKDTELLREFIERNKK